MDKADKASIDYLRLREMEERQAAAAAVTAEVRRIHLDLAEAYALRIRNGQLQRDNMPAALSDENAP